MNCQFFARTMCKGVRSNAVVFVHGCTACWEDGLWPSRPDQQSGGSGWRIRRSWCIKGEVELSDNQGDLEYACVAGMSGMLSKSLYFKDLCLILVFVDS